MPNGYKGISQEGLIPYLTKAIQEQQVEKQSKNNKQKLESQNQKLEEFNQYICTKDPTVDFCIN